MTRPRAAFLVFLLALVGGNIAQVQGVLAQWFFTDQLPATGLFRWALLFVWLPVAVMAAWCGLAGGFAALQTNRLTSSYLTWFTALQCVMIKVDGVELGWMLYRISFHVGGTRFAVGLNVLGLAVVFWLARLRRAEAGPAPTLTHPTAGTESVRT